MAFLKIENPGVAPSEAFTLLGASTKGGRGDTRTIGKFGSGNKHGVSVCLRHGQKPVIFASNLRMDFDTKPCPINDGLRTSEFARVVVKYGGKDDSGKQRSATEDLGYVLEYGASDWTGIELALREFVSNSIDRAIDEGEAAFVTSYLVEHGCDSQEAAKAALVEYRKTATDYKAVVVEIVGDNQVRAKAGHTRVFVPLNEDVLKFHQNIGKWFLHFSEPESLDKTILPKANRNIGDRKAAVIYRKGVRVREFESSDVPSLFDYNLDNLELDEARKVDDWRVKWYAAQAMAGADAATLAVLFSSFKMERKYWEQEFDASGLEPHWQHSTAITAARAVNWQKAATTVQGDNAVLATAGNGEAAIRKGFSVLSVPESFVAAARHYGVKTPDKVLSQDDRDGREVIDATPDALAALDFVWGVVEGHGMTDGKDRPSVKVFRKIMEGGAQTLGFYRDSTVYLNADIAGYGSIEGGQNALSQQLLVTAMEEVAHHVTGATDNSRDFQDYLLNLAVKLAKTHAGIL